jgi:hypothetical protein
MADMISKDTEKGKKKAPPPVFQVPAVPEKLRTWAVVLLVLFLALIYSVPVAQGAVELRQSLREHAKDPSRSVRIQMLDLLADSFIEPLKNSNALHNLLYKAVMKCDSIAGEITKITSAPDSGAPKDFSLVNEMLDDQSFVVGDAKKVAYTVNRHINADTTKRQFLRFDTLRTKITDLESGISDMAPADVSTALGEIRTRAQSLLSNYPHRTVLSVPALFCKVFFYIYWGDKYLRPYEKEMKDKSIFANAIRPSMFYMWYKLTGDLGEKAVMGRDGWFFYKPDVDFLVRPWVTEKSSRVVDPNDKPFREDPVKTIVDFRDQLKAAGIDLIVVIMPVKPSIYPDELNPRMKPEKAGTFTHSLRVLKQLHEQGVETINLFSAFANERKNDKTGDSLYLHKDTHWKARAVRLAARLTAERIEQYPWFAEDTSKHVSYVLDSVTIDRVGDVGVMTTLPAYKFHSLTVSFEPEKTRCYQVYKVEKNPDGTESRSLYQDELRGSRVLLLGDSFSRIYQTDEPGSAGWISHLAYYLREPVASIVSDGGASTLVRERLARKPGMLKGKKVVVWEFVERDFRYGEEGWKDIPITMK